MKIKKKLKEEKLQLKKEINQRKEINN
jgi:hypothetical protein